MAVPQAMMLQEVASAVQASSGGIGASATDITQTALSQINLKLLEQLDTCMKLKFSPGSKDKAKEDEEFKKLADLHTKMSTELVTNPSSPRDPRFPEYAANAILVERVLGTDQAQADKAMKYAHYEHGNIIRLSQGLANQVSNSQATEAKEPDSGTSMTATALRGLAIAASVGAAIGITVASGGAGSPVSALLLANAPAIGNAAAGLAPVISQAVSTIAPAIGQAASAAIGTVMSAVGSDPNIPSQLMSTVGKAVVKAAADRYGQKSEDNKAVVGPQQTPQATAAQRAAASFKELAPPAPGPVARDKDEEENRARNAFSPSPRPNA